MPAVLRETGAPGCQPRFQNKRYVGEVAGGPCLKRRHQPHGRLGRPQSFAVHCSSSKTAAIEAERLEAALLRTNCLYR